jgi:hypothetical protein
MSIRKEYLNRKSKRHEFEGESVTEENGKNSNSINKTEEELSTPMNINLEKSSSTPSNENKVQESQNRPLNEYLNKKFEFFQKQIDNLKEQNGKQQREIEKLNSQVKKINEFYFAGKLRKLLKKLIQFIINYYFYSYMKYNKSTKRIYFVQAPRPTIHLNLFKDGDIIDALNRILELSFSKVKSQDFIIHFIDKRTNKDNSLKKVYLVFKNKNEFFDYFSISEKDKVILNEIFPEEYLTLIDNSSFDINIKSLINVVEI